ncbi:MAG: hypothetical protein IH608_12720 [Proteobacteria bacterium]|nr:hypothetical protein [Pseudomonadota bacterium]
MEIRTVAVLGAGIMGNGIAQVTAVAGYPVALRDIEDSLLQAAMSRIATREDIDKACRLALNHPMGPFELADFSGLDTKLSVSDVLTEAFGDRFRSPQTVRTMVSAGHLGRKTGKGWFAYSK